MAIAISVLEVGRISPSLSQVISSCRVFMCVCVCIPEHRVLSYSRRRLKGNYNVNQLTSLISSSNVKHDFVLAHPGSPATS